MNSDHQKALGERLRSIRQQQGLTLHDVEERSGGTWKAVVVGSYERGDRAISIAKLNKLAGFYGVPLHTLLPRPATARATSEGTPERLVLDLTRLDHNGDDRLETINRFASSIQAQRGDYNGRMLTLRERDLDALSAVLAVDSQELVTELRLAQVLND